jgi:hypothetical protein
MTAIAAADVAALRAAIDAAAPRLHGVASRGDADQIAAEALRLNTSVRTSAAGRIDSGAHPNDFAALLLASADPFGALASPCVPP